MTSLPPSQQSCSCGEFGTRQWRCHVHGFEAVKAENALLRDAGQAMFLALVLPAERLMVGQRAEAIGAWRAAAMTGKDT